MTAKQDRSLSRLGGHSLIYAASSVLGQLGSLLTFPLYTRALGPSSYGILAIGLAAAGVLRTLVISGTNTALMHARIGADERRARESTGAAVAWVVIVSVALGLVWLLFSPLIAAVARLGENATAFGWGVIAYVFADSLLELMFSVARAESRPRVYALANGLRVVVTIAAAVVLLVGLHVGASGALVAMAIASLTACTWLVWQLRVRISLHDVARRLQRLLSDGLPLLPANLGSWVTDLADRYLLLFITGSTVLVGVYSAGYRVGSLVTVLFVGPFHTAYLPFMLEHAEHESAEHLYAETSRLFLAFGAVTVLVLQAVAFPLVRVLAGSSYLSSVRIVGVVALGCLLAGAAMLMTPEALKERRTSSLAVAFGAGAVLNVAANLVLIPTMGMLGAALATLGAYALVLLVILVLTPRSARPRGIWTEIGRVVPVTAVAVCIAAIDFGGGGRQGLVSLACAAVGFGLLVAVGALRVADVTRVAGSLSSALTRRGVQA